MWFYLFVIVMTQFTRDWGDILLRNGNKYLVSRRPEGVADDESEELVLRNTSSNEVMYVETVVFKNSRGKAYIDATKNLSVDSSGDSADVEDMRVDDEDTVEGFEAEFGGDYSGGDSFTLDLLTGSSGGGPSVSATSVGSETAGFLVAPGENMLFEITNKSGDTSDMLLEAIVTVADE